MKKWWKSKTIWFQIITVVIAVAQFVASGGGVVSSGVVFAAGLVVVLANVALRLVTNQSIGSGNTPNTPDPPAPVA